MAGIFTIAPINSLAFVRDNGNLPSFDNTLYQDMDRVVSKLPYCQMIQKNDVITIQIKTDFTVVTAQLYNVVTGAMTTLTPTLETSYPTFDFYEVAHTFSTNGLYKLFIGGTLTGYESVSYVSEMIEVRDSWDGVRIDFYNGSNTGYVDYSTGIRHLMRVFGFVKFSDIGGKDEFYNNFGTEERIYSENETIYELFLEDVPYYLARQLIYAGKLDYFYVNDSLYTVKEHSLSAHPSSHNSDLTLKLTQRIVPGINGDYESNAV